MSDDQLAELVQLARHPEASRIRGNDELAHAPMTGGTFGGVRRPREQADPVGLYAIGDVQLATVDDPLVAVAYSTRPNGRHIRAGVRLGHADGRDHLAANGGREIALLELLGAEGCQRRRGHHRLDSDGHRNAAASGARQLFAQDDGEQMIGTLAAVGRVVFQSQQPELAEAGEDLVCGEHARALPLVDARSYLTLDDVTHHLAERVVFFGELDHASPCDEIPAGFGVT